MSQCRDLTGDLTLLPVELCIVGPAGGRLLECAAVERCRALLKLPLGTIRRVHRTQRESKRDRVREDGKPLAHAVRAPLYARVGGPLEPFRTFAPTAGLGFQVMQTVTGLLGTVNVSRPLRGFKAAYEGARTLIFVH